MDVRGKTPALPNYNTMVDSLFCDDDIAYSTYPIAVMRKIQKKVNREIIALAYQVPQTDAIKERLQQLMQRAQNMKVSSNEIFNYNINLKNGLYFLFFYVRN